jgi:hypothetical protein
MTSGAEQNLSRSLRQTLARAADGADLAPIGELHEVLEGLDWLLHEALGEIHPEWREDSPDGLLPLSARKIGDGEAEVFGHCLLLRDMAVVPFHVQLRVAPTADEIAWLDCQLGELRDGKMIRTPYDSRNFKQLFRPADSNVAWAYHVAFGER